MKTNKELNNKIWYRFSKVIYYFLYIFSLIVGIIVFPIIIIIFEMFRNIFNYIITGIWSFKFNSKIWNYIINVLNYIKNLFEKDNNIFGIRRIKYLLYFISSLIIFLIGISFILSNYKSDSIFLYIILFIFFLFFLNISYERLHNMGKSGWNIFGLLFPIVNIIILFQLFFVSEKEKNNKIKVEKKYIILISFFVIIFIIIGLGVYSFLKMEKTVEKIKMEKTIEKIKLENTVKKVDVVDKIIKINKNQSNIENKKIISVIKEKNKKIVKKVDGNIYFFIDGKEIEFLTNKATLEVNCDNIQFVNDDVIKKLGGIKDNSDHYSFVNYEILINNGNYGIIKKVNNYCEASIDNMFFIDFSLNDIKLNNIDVKGKLSGSHIGDVKINGDILEVELYGASGSIKKYFNLKSIMHK